MDKPDKTELNPTPPDDTAALSSEQQLSLTFDDIEKKPGIISAEEYLKIKNAVRDKTQPSGQTAPEEKSEPQNAPEKSQNKVKQDNSQNEKKAPSTEKTAESVPVPLAPAPHLSDMEVMEHTASIWQYKEIVDNGTEMHSEYHQKRTVTPFAEITGARVRGKKHKHEGTNCDDYFETAVTDDCVIAVVCDGAGSKPLSRIGSRVSAESAAAYLKTKTAELLTAKPEMKSGLAADLSSAEFMAACGRIAPLVQEAAREAFAAQRKALGEL